MGWKEGRGRWRVGDTGNLYLLISSEQILLLIGRVYKSKQGIDWEGDGFMRVGWEGVAKGLSKEETEVKP